MPKKPRSDDLFNSYTLPINKRVDIFFDKIFKLNDSMSIEKLCSEEKKLLQKIYQNTNTRHRYYTKYRKYILNYSQLYFEKKPYGKVKNYQNHLEKIELIKKTVLRKLKLSKQERELRQKNIDISLDLKTNQVALFNLHEFVDTCRKLISQRDNPYTVAVGLMGLTGRRSIEILKTAIFVPISEYSMQFSGQVKTKNSPNARLSYPIPVLDQSQKIFKALQFIRESIPLSNLDNEKIDKLYGRKLLYWVKQLKHCIFPNQWIPLNCRSLRSIYVSSTYHLLNMSTKVSFNAYAAKVLGHSLLDKNTANSYTYYAILPENNPSGPYPEIMKDFKTLDSLTKG